MSGSGGLSHCLTGRPDDYQASWNVKPTHQIPITFTSQNYAVKSFGLVPWSLVAPWSASTTFKFPTLNARSEQIALNALYIVLKPQRRLNPGAGFYRWSGPKSSRASHAFFDPNPILPLAGLYSWWRQPAAIIGEGWCLTVRILTRTSTGMMKSLHVRMPVRMSDGFLLGWLDPDTVGDQLLLDAVSKASIPISEQLCEHTVKPFHGDGPELIEPASSPS
nr:SOS response-associated peptidase family protein [Leucobacter chromiireducens]